MKLKRIGIDLVKQVFQLHGVDSHELSQLTFLKMTGTNMTYDEIKKLVKETIDQPYFQMSSSSV